MNEIINKAVEGGWDDETAKVTNYDKRDGYEGMATSMYSTHKALLDPLFWQALSKSCGWRERNYAYILSNTINQYTHDAGAPQWKFIALRFHEINLTEGWNSAIEYLYNLLPPKENDI